MSEKILYGAVAVALVISLVSLTLGRVVPVSPVVVSMAGGVPSVIQTAGDVMGIDTALASRLTDLVVENDLQVDGSANISDLTDASSVRIPRPVGTGSVYTTSSAASTSLTASQVCSNSVISMTPSAGVINVTLPSTTTLQAACLTTAGDSVSFIYENGATAATNTTIVAGTGITLVSDDSGGDVIGQNGWAKITISNVRAAEYVAIIDPYTNAD